MIALPVMSYSSDPPPRGAILPGSRRYSTGRSPGSFGLAHRADQTPGSLSADAAHPPRVCMLSYHTCPLAAPGGKETGGMNVYVRELSRELGRRGRAIDIFTRSESADVPHVVDTDLGETVRVVHVPAGPEKPAGKAEVWQHAGEFVEGILLHLADWRLSYDLYHAHYWMSGWVARQLQREHPAPLIQMFHTLGALKDLARGDGAVPEIAPRREEERRIMEVADAIVASTPADWAAMEALYGVDAGRVHLIPPGVDLALFRPMEVLEAANHVGMAPDHRMILFVGRMDPVKGLDTLVRAMAKVVEWEPQWQDQACLCIVGGDKTDDRERMDEEMARIDALRHELGLASVAQFLGSLPQEELPYYYNAAQVVVVPSRYESFGMVALEAMACGTPVIASNVGGLASIVRDGQTGYLVPDGDEVALALRLRQLLDDPDLRCRLGRHGRATAEAYGWPSIAERVETLYDVVLERARSRI